MNTSNKRRITSVSGLTLIELVVVLAILVALAGLIIGNFPGLVKRAGRSSAASSVGDINRAVQVEYTTTLRFPDQMDSLIQTGSSLYSSIATNGLGTNLNVAALSATEASALVSAGITTSYLMEASGEPTFNPTPTPTTLFAGAAGSGLAVEILPTSTVTNIFGPKVGLSGATSRYLLFGLGNRCTLVGPTKTMFEAPVHFGETANANPKTSYQRYVLCFALDTISGNTTVRYVGAAAIDNGGLTGAEENLKQYWNN